MRGGLLIFEWSNSVLCVQEEMQAICKSRSLQVREYQMSTKHEAAPAHGVNGGNHGMRELTAAHDVRSIPHRVGIRIFAFTLVNPILEDYRAAVPRHRGTADR